MEISPDTLARISSLTHPTLLLSAFYAKFPSLVSDPTRALLEFLPLLTIIQIIYAVVCLPCVESGPLKKAKAGVKKGPVKHAERIKTIFLALILASFAVPFLVVVQILFGAPLTTHLLHTILSSTHLSLLSLFPLIYVYGINTAKWKEIISIRCPIDEVFGGTLGTFVGGWLGAIPIPLDWDRDWQKWPITIVTGMYMGHIVGILLGRWILKGKKVEFD
ncbi:Glycosylphosphatidylinositol anchor biosynthesis protein 11 [Golovinomyces cichoracearum]|uniref:Glycosylphosphatidylinositol anchor biosynthesis protein 11 n=1 Tax=Golovinomyces cichoracearum TaxID=62708 RepID=A0A420ICK7_9PEZI|nr:Glycosylphosphatidylinositol anchor biosynthesis protein 11 [Golovinomyces cichoracearum]